MSYETVSELREKNITGILTDTSDIESNVDEKSIECFNFFSNLILDEMWNIKSAPYTSFKEPIDCWIAGGCIRNYFLNEPFTNDIDIYFPDAINYKRAETLFRQRGSKLIFSNKNCEKVYLDGKTFDLIKIFYTNPKVCISNFDLTVCSGCVSKDGFISHKLFFPHLRSKTLKELCPNPETIEFRREKYRKMGFVNES